MPQSTQSIDTSFWGQFQTAVEDTSTWVASTWTALGTSEVADPEAAQGQTKTRTALSSRSMSFVPSSEVKRSFQVEENTHGDDTTKTIQLPVKFTFIHFEVQEANQKQDRPRGMARQTSAPGVLCTVPFSEKLSPMERAHWKGSCKPCAYFHKKADSCRRGEDCEFCHICRPEELLKQTRAKRKAQHEARKKSRQVTWSRTFSQEWSHSRRNSPRVSVHHPQLSLSEFVQARF